MPGESDRLAALRRYEILDTPTEAEFDDFTRLAAHLCGTPMALISFVDANRQWFKSELGLGARETPLEASICRHAIAQRELFIVPDTLEDERFRNYPNVVGEPKLRFYAGAVLEDTGGAALGSLCVLDRRPRELTAAQQHGLQLLARQVMNTLRLRLTARQLALRNAELEAARREIETLKGLLRICAKCKRIHENDDSWVAVETYIQRHIDVNFTHGLCPDCQQQFLAELERLRPEN